MEVTGLRHDRREALLAPREEGEVRAFPGEAKGDGPTAYLEKDEEHGVFDIRVQAGANGQQREVEVGDEFVSSAEYRALYSAYEEIRELDQPPLTVVDGGETVIESREALVQHVLTEGKKGMTLSRYKGLGEMNADELWETTMDPERRRLLQVTVEEAAIADQIFSILMGDDVEKRKEFIQTNSKDAFIDV